MNDRRGYLDWLRESISLTGYHTHFFGCDVGLIDRGIKILADIYSMRYGLCPPQDHYHYNKIC